MRKNLRLTRIRLLAPLVVGALLAFAGPAHAAPTFGFSENWDQRPAGIGIAADLGATAGRQFVSWGVIEPVRGQYRWGGLDAEYNALLAKGLRPLWVVHGSPRWSWPAGTACSSCPYPPAPAYDGDWRQFLALLAERYPKALGIEIWNEPNMARFYAPRPDPVRFTQLVKEAYGAIKAVSSLPVVSGGLVALPGGSDMPGDQFLQAMYDSGVKGNVDAIGIHPYPGFGGVVSNMRAKIDLFRSVRDRNGDSSRPFWVTETGLSTKGDNVGHPRFSEPDQATGLAGMYRALYGMADVPVVIFYRLIDMPPDDWESGLGIYRSDLSPKGSVAALRDAIASPQEGAFDFHLGASVNPAEIGQQIVFTATGYPGAGPVRYDWDLNGNGQFERNSGANPSFTRAFQHPGAHTVIVEASDRFERYRARLTVIVKPNRRPVARIKLAPSRAFVSVLHAAAVKPRRQLTFSAKTSYDPDLTGFIRHYAWDIQTEDRRFHHYTSPTIRYGFRRPGRYRIKLAVTDNHGGVSRTTLIVRVTRRLPRAAPLVPLAAPLPAAPAR